MNNKSRISISDVLKLFAGLSETLAALAVFIVALGFSFRSGENSSTQEFFYLEFEQIEYFTNLELGIVFIFPLILMTFSTLFRSSAIYIAEEKSKISRISSQIGALSSFMALFHLVLFFRVEALAFILVSYICIMIAHYNTEYREIDGASLVFNILNYFSASPRILVTTMLIAAALLLPSITGASIQIEAAQNNKIVNRIQSLINDQREIREKQHECFRDYVEIRQQIIFYTTFVTQKFDMECSQEQVMRSMLDQPRFIGENVLEEPLQIGDITLPAGIDFDIFTYMTIIRTLALTYDGFRNEQTQMINFISDSEINQALCTEFEDSSRHCLVRVEARN